MRRASEALAIALFVVPGVAAAGNDDQVVAGTDVALTGGAVVANVHTGGALWYNPAGVARLDGRSLTFSGALIDYSRVRAPGALSIENGEQSAGVYDSLHVVPRAIAFSMAPRPNLRWGIGLFYSRSLSSFVQDSVSTSASATEPAEFFASSNERKIIYHLSSAVAWKKSKKLLLGGGLDIVFASQRVSQTISGSYNQGQGGALSLTENQGTSGAGLQWKAGIQWAPVKQLRIGWMVATPSYLFFLSEKSTTTQTTSPPTGPPSFSGSQSSGLEGSWAGIEQGLTRFGVAYLGSWGWVEGDVIVAFPLQTPQLDVHWKTTTDAHIGGVFNVTGHLQLGCGFFTDFSAEPAPSEFAATNLSSYGFVLGADFANRAESGEDGKSGFYIALATAFRYAHGTGTLGGIAFPSTYPSPPTQPTQINVINATVDELSVIVAVKAAF